MRRLKTVVTAVVAVAALSAVMSASAFAVALPEFSVKTNATSSFGASTFETTSSLLGAITSPNGSAELTATSKTLGALHLMFKGVKCHGPFGETAAGESLGDTKETVLVLGEYHLVRLSSGHVGAWLLINAVHIECLFSTGTLLLTVHGDLLGELTPVLTKTKNYELKLTQSKGKQGITEYENDSGVKVKAGGLKTSIDEGGEVASAQETQEGKITTVEETTLEKTT